MCKIMEDFAAEERAAQAEEFAIGMLKIGKMSYAEIAEVSKLSEEKIKKLAEKMKNAAEQYATLWHGSQLSLFMFS